MNHLTLTACMVALAMTCTPLMGATILLQEDFEGTFPPTDWTADGWQPATDLSSTYAQLTNPFSATASTLVSPVFSLVGMSDAELTFSWTPYESTSVGPLTVQLHEGGTLAAILFLQSPTATNNPYLWASWGSVPVDLTPYVGKSDLSLVWSAGPIAEWQPGVDNVSVTGTPVPEPATLIFKRRWR